MSTKLKTRGLCRLPRQMRQLLVTCVVLLSAGILCAGCGPAVPKEELGEILTDIPPELQFQEPYPVPWANQPAGGGGASSGTTSPEEKPAAEVRAPQAEGPSQAPATEPQAEGQPSSAGPSAEQEPGRPRPE
ncbi:MAG: hypothetical protein RMJ16_03135 [Thermoguttaceae bacterium]|nr:hypothetical protein [Thermoguttaceae bacterium]